MSSSKKRKVKKKKVKKGRKFKLFVLLVLALAVFVVVTKFRTTHQMVAPYPYVMGPYNLDTATSEKISKSSVLIIGDRMAGKLANFREKLSQLTSKNLREPLEVFDWSKKREGLHRTINKLKTLKRIPPIVIYHGASEEFFEKKFYVADKVNIYKNFEKYHDDFLLSLILTFPPISRFIYHRVHYIDLDKRIIRDNLPYSDINKQIQMEIGYKIFEYELTELIDLAKERKFTLVLLTTPINLDIPPKNVCDNTTNDQLISFQNDLEKKINAGVLVSAYNDLKKLQKKTIGNARTLYLLGKAAFNSGKAKDGKRYLELATAYDCDTWRTNAVFNSIIRNYANKNKLFLIDFDYMVNVGYGKNTLFFDEVLPQNIFYDQVIIELARTVKEVLQL